MRADVPSYELVRAKSLDEALALLPTHRPFAGGTDLMVVFEAGRLAHKKYVSLWHVPELQGIAVTDTHITLGARATYREIREHAVLQKEFPNLCAAARETGAFAIQNRGTIGGNIANASPAADTPPALLAYDAQIELVSPRGRRMLAYDTFHSGYKQTALAEDELIASVVLKRGTKRAHYYRKVGTRKAQAISKVCLAATARLEGATVRDARFAFGSMAPVPHRARHAEAAVEGRPVDETVIAAARQALAKDLAAIDDVRSTREYRALVAANVLAQFLELLRTQAR